MSRGLRNCNPGNIRRTGKVRYRGEKKSVTDPEFREFTALEWGYRAMFTLLYTYYRRYRLGTLRELVSRWAPPTENRTDAYIGFVAELTGTDPDRRIDLLDAGQMIPVVAAMSQVENGQKADLAKVERGWELFFMDFGTKRS